MHPPTSPTPSSPPLSIIIAGAGIGGLVTALHLHAHGLTNIHIFEASPALTTLGVGINIQPSAVLILRDLGLLTAMTSTGIQTKELNYYDRFGNAIVSEPRGLDAGYTIPQVSIHRGELQMLLLDAVKERIGIHSIHLDHALDSFEQDDDTKPVSGTSLPGTITAHFVRRRSTALKPEIPSMTANLLIAADGINSTARRLLYPSEGPAKFSGRMLWRGCIERDPYLTGATMAWCGHANQKFIAYPISSQSARQNPSRSLVNWIAELRTRAADDPDLTPPKPDWTKSVPKSRFAGAFESWTFGFLDIPSLIRDTEKVYEFPMCDRDPVERWSFGRMTLLGDAAHPMYPIGSNGASQSIIDSQTLTECLLKNKDDVPAALTAYQNIRLPATAKIVMANRGNGPDQALQLAYERAPDGFRDIYDVIPKEELEGIGLAYKAIAGFEIDKVNAAAKESEGLSESLGLRSPENWTVGRTINGTHNGE